MTLTIATFAGIIKKVLEKKVSFVGCDIHAYLEEHVYTFDEDGKEQWHTFASFRPSRDYTIFALMAGVRDGWGFVENGFNFEPKGLPENVSWGVEKANTYYVQEEGQELLLEEGEKSCVRKRAEEWVKEGRSKWVADDRITDPDYHSHSWLSKEELEEVLRRVPEEGGQSRLFDEIKAIIVTMEALEEKPGKKKSSRLVFWFDS